MDESKSAHYALSADLRHGPLLHTTTGIVSVGSLGRPRVSFGKVPNIHVTSTLPSAKFDASPRVDFSLGLCYWPIGVVWLLLPIAFATVHTAILINVVRQRDPSVFGKRAGFLNKLQNFLVGANRRDGDCRLKRIERNTQSAKCPLVDRQKMIVPFAHVLLLVCC